MENSRRSDSARERTPKASTDAKPTYVDWLNAYETKLKTMSEQALHKENHADERHQSQTYVDYLDYVEEWRWHQREQVNQLTCAMVYSLSRTSQRIECGNHHHILTTAKKTETISGEQIHVDRPASLIHNECWYKTIHEQVQQVLNGLSNENLRLAEPMERALTMIATWRLAHSSVTPTLLPYDTFKTVWWDAAENGSTSKLAKYMLERLSLADAQKVRRMHIEQTPTPKLTERQVIFDYPQGEHGLHALQNAVGPDIFKQVLSFINGRRRDRGCHEKITLDMIQSERNVCTHCHPGPHPGLSALGVYYAPPGTGKTTAQDKEYLVALDTDWIGKGITWREMSPMLNKKIPILTNQCEGFIGSGLKVVGVYNHKLRLAPNGKPYTTFEAVEAMQRVQRVNYDFSQIPENQYFADHVLKMQIKQVLQRMIAEYTIDRLPHYRNHVPDDWGEEWNRLMKGDVIRVAL